MLAGYQANETSSSTPSPPSTMASASSSSSSSSHDVGEDSPYYSNLSLLERFVCKGVPGVSKRVRWQAIPKEELYNKMPELKKVAEITLQSQLSRLPAHVRTDFEGDIASYALDNITQRTSDFLSVIGGFFTFVNVCEKTEKYKLSMVCSVIRLRAYVHWMKMNYAVNTARNHCFEVLLLLHFMLTHRELRNLQEQVKSSIAFLRSATATLRQELRVHGGEREDELALVNSGKFFASFEERKTFVLWLLKQWSEGKEHYYRIKHCRCSSNAELRRRFREHCYWMQDIWIALSLEVGYGQRREVLGNIVVDSLEYDKDSNSYSCLPVCEKVTRTGSPRVLLPPIRKTFDEWFITYIRRYIAKEETKTLFVKPSGEAMSFKKWSRVVVAMGVRFNPALHLTANNYRRMAITNLFKSPVDDITSADNVVRSVEMSTLR